AREASRVKACEEIRCGSEAPITPWMWGDDLCCPAKRVVDRSSPGNALLHRSFPVLAVEVSQREGGEIDIVQAAHVDVDLVGVGTRHVERMNATHPAEGVLGGLGVEDVSGEIVLPAQQLEPFGWHDQVQDALLGADGAIAFRDLCKLGGDAKAHPAAMATAFHRPYHRSPCRRVQGSPSSPPENSWNWPGSRAGSARPRWRNACEVKSRPRGVRWTKPCWIRNGSMMS